MINYPQVDKISSLNHSYVCVQIMRQLLQDSNIQPLPELTLDIENGLTPDISIFKIQIIKPNFFEDILKIKELPMIVIEVISSSQNIQSLFNKSKILLNAGIPTIWIIEPYGKSVFVFNSQEKKLFHEDLVESDGVKVDFKKVFI